MSDDIRIPTISFYDVSTAHLTANDKKLLSARKQPIFVMRETEYGFMVHSIVDSADEAREAGYSDALIELLKRAERSGLYGVNFDRDALVVPELPIFES